MAEDKSAGERGPDVIAPPPLLYLIPLVAGLLLDRRLPLPRLPRGVRLSGLPLLAGGLGLGGFAAHEQDASQWESGDEDYDALPPVASGRVRRA